MHIDDSNTEEGAGIWTGWRIYDGDIIATESVDSDLPRLRVHSNLVVDGYLYMRGNLHVGGNLEVSSNLVMGGKLIVRGRLIVRGYIYAGGYIYVSTSK